MASERLEFGMDGMDYHAVTAAQHISRYYFARSFCVGKRVLDIACGEGYGSRLLADWGAAEVVGIDISAEAIGKAETYFSGENIQYIQADGCGLSEKFLADERFDLICVFETIEHVSDLGVFLKNIRKLLRVGGTIIISCPNDNILPAHDENIFHLRVFNLGDFKVETEAVLGKASGWFFGTPMQGYTIFPEAALEDGSGTKMTLAVAGGRGGGDLWMLPQQSGIVARPDNVDFFVGFWGGGKPEQFSVASPLSQTAFIEPWVALDALRAELDVTKAESEAAASRLVVLEHESQAQSQAARSATSELEALRAELSQLNEALRITQRDLELRASDLRRTEIVLAEERRVALRWRSVLERPSQPPSLSVSREDMYEIAKEVWWERNRRLPPYKIGKMLIKLFRRAV